MDVEFENDDGEFNQEGNWEHLFHNIEELMEEDLEYYPFGEVEHNGLAPNPLNGNEDVVTLSNVSATQVREGMDMQAIPWENMLFQREEYRVIRLRNYMNYQNLSYNLDYVDKECSQVQKGSTFYDFNYHAGRHKLAIVHFQLRNLVWATSKHDVYTTRNSFLEHWSSSSRTSTEVLDVGQQIKPTQRGPGSLAQSVSGVQVSTMAVKDNLLAAGGFQGELVCKYLDQAGVFFSTRVANNDNAITNSIEIYKDSNGTTKVVAANNDCSVRIFDTERFSLLKHIEFLWSVNSCSVSPDRELLAVLGDDEDCLLVDAKSGKMTEILRGHVDYSFASAWHPSGNILATGSQDRTCRLWDVRYPSKAFAVLKGRMGSIRGIKFSADGSFLATAEPTDFVHIYDAKADYGKAQEIDFFGEIAGLSFSPDDEALFIGIADFSFGGLMEFTRRRNYEYLDRLF